MISVIFPAKLTCWCGLRKAILLVPGGQSEMIGIDSQSKDIAINTRHRGFLRLAIKLGVQVVPVRSFRIGFYYTDRSLILTQ